MQTGKLSLTSGEVILSLYFSRAQLLPPALSWERLGENRASVLPHLTNTSCPAQGGPSISYLTPGPARLNGGVQNELPLNEPLWCMDYFELRSVKAQKIQEEFLFVVCCLFVFLTSPVTA